VESVVDKLASDGCKQVLVAPIGFLCDHVETLYDIDIELKRFAAGRGLQLERIAMLNDSAALIDTLTAVLAAHESSLCPAS
jgi:ferrochelatase